MGKRYLSLAVSLIVLLGMLWGPASAGLAEGAQVKITLWHSMSDLSGELMEKLVKEFNEGTGKEKGIQVESVFQGSYSDSTTKMRTILQNGQGDQLPDVMQIDSTGIVDYQATDYKYTVNDALAADPSYDMSQILEVPLMNWNYNGLQLGMPFSTSTALMYYNKTMLDTAGVAAAPTTFQEITDAAAKLPRKTADGRDIWAFAGVPNTPTLANWIGQIKGDGVNASYVVDNKNGRTGSATKLVCDTEGTLAAFLTEWKKMYDAKALFNQSNGLSDLFIAGQLAVYSTYSSNLNSLLNTIGGSFELGCAYLPRVNSHANFGATVSGSGMFMFNKGDAGKTAAAWEFVKYLASSDVQAVFSTGTGYLPANKGSYETETYTSYVAEYPQLKVAVDQVLETSVDMLGVTVGPSWDFYMEMMNQISAGLDSGASVDDMVSSISSTLNDILAQYNAANQ